MCLDIGAENAEVCQWTFYGQGRKKAEVRCFHSSVVYSTSLSRVKFFCPKMCSECFFFKNRFSFLSFSCLFFCGKKTLHAYSPAVVLTLIAPGARNDFRIRLPGTCCIPAFKSFIKYQFSVTFPREIQRFMD